MEKTLQQKLASKERYFIQIAKAKELLQTENLYDFIDGIKYAYSLSMRYKSVNLYQLLTLNCPHDLLENSTRFPLNKCLKAGILKPWNNTYYFDKEKAESLQQYILENSTN